MDKNNMLEENQQLKSELEKCKKLINQLRRHLQQHDDQQQQIIEKLSTREIEIIELIASGHSTKSIASMLNRSPSTIESHRSNILQKLGINNMAELVLVASKAGIV